MDLFLLLHDLTQLLQHIENICYLFLLMGFIVPFYDFYNTINEHNQRQTRYFSFILNYFDVYF